ncbi:MAG: type II secretion system F family protein [Wujia sp.]
MTGRDSYSAYIPDRRWNCREAIKLIFCAGTAGLLFFDSWLGMLVSAPLAVAIWRGDRQRYMDMKKDQMKEEFRDLIAMLAADLHVGYALENSFVKSADKLKKMYGDRCLSEPELNGIINGMHYNRNIEVLLLDFGRRSGICEIVECASLIAITKIYGGDMIYVIHQISANLAAQSSVEMEIATAVAAKRMEGGIMLLMPFAIVLYMRIVDPGYLDVLYHTSVGHFLMAACLAVVLFSGWIINRIIKIEV